MVRKLRGEELQGVVAQYSKAVATVAPSQPEFWHALFGWALHSPQIVLVDPLANLDRIQHTVLAAAEKNARTAIQHVFSSLVEMRHGRIRTVLSTLPLVYRQNQIPGLWNILNGVIQLPVELHGYYQMWRQGSKAKVFLTERLATLRQIVLRPTDIRRLYEAFPGVSLVQEAFVRDAAGIAPVSGQPRSLAQLGRIRNAELRRCLVAVYGVKAHDAPLQRDDYGALYAVDELTNAVHVICPSTGREYWLGVPATCETARAAVLWSFGLEHQNATHLTLLKEA